MTYCVGLCLDRGMVFMSDTRTNAGVDNISTFRKMTNWDVPGERSITLMSAGNLATTQAVVSLIEERSKEVADRDPDIMSAKSMFQVATLVGRTLKEVIAANAVMVGQRADSAFNATLLVGGQVGDGEMRLFLIYPEGNFIEASADTPFFQIGETKYGRPIILRAYDPTMSFEEAIKLLLVSFDSTIKANLSVSPPLDVHIYERDSLQLGRTFRIDGDDPYFLEISNGWGAALREAFTRLPPFSFDKYD
ncbi:proteasome-type protease [Thalassovita taeanensis]|uniref:Putative proteasome-type protease n=1 Tax=Thalassovita taeanensis TaxID=657014 RepID=A0A1H9EM73_9RHOB|nr:proteasome-type protease [Thalassovita taeanensis]SEQ26323.1 putative proteasome-type protease [Thalassovita taeanensis]